jgi:hypothetical protein
VVLQSKNWPKIGYAIEIDGRINTEFNTKDGAEHGAIELKARFPMPRIRVNDSANQSLQEMQS